MRLERKILRPYGVKATAEAEATGEPQVRTGLEFKATDDGRISGYGSVFGVVDSYREVVEKGAFKDSIRQLKAEGSLLPMLWQHRSGEPLGVWDEFEEDSKGLKLAGGVVMESATAKERFAFVKAGAVRGLSIGYYVLEDSFNEKERIRTLKKVELVETSIVTFPANREALADPIKAKLRAGGVLTEREFERKLREELRIGHRDAVLIAEHGYKAWLQRRETSPGANDGDADLKSALADAIDDLRKPLFG